MFQRWIDKQLDRLAKRVGDRINYQLGQQYAVKLSDELEAQVLSLMEENAALRKELGTFHQQKQAYDKAFGREAL